MPYPFGYAQGRLFAHFAKGRKWECMETGT